MAPAFPPYPGAEALDRRQPTITPLLITFNEEDNLVRVLDRLRWAERVVVIDSFSSDGTLDILTSYPNVDVYRRPFTSFADQCNYGLTKVDSEWVLSLDADYVLTDAFVDEMIGLDFAADGYEAGFTYCIYGKPLRGSLYPPRTVLFRRSKAHYVVDGHAHRLDVRGEVRTMSATILHDDRKPLPVWLNAQRRYAEQEAEKLLSSRDLPLPDRIRAKRWVAPVLAPLYCLLRKGVILDGPAGWLYAFQRAYFELLVSLYLSDAAYRAAPRLTLHPKEDTLTSRAA